jgi:hypothetical protein
MSPWFDANLATDFFNTNTDGTFVDRKAWLSGVIGLLQGFQSLSMQGVNCACS